MRSYVIIFALGACAEPAIDMSLQLPPQMPANFSLDCVTAIDVQALGEFEGDAMRPPDVQSDCLDVAGLTSFADVRAKMHDQFELAIPDSGLAGITVRGSVGKCGDGLTHEGVFYGGAEVTGDSVKIPLVANLSCNARGKLVNVHAVDLLALSSTKTCGVTDAGRVFAADFRPTLLDTTDTTLEGGASAGSQWRNGTTSVEVFSATVSSQTCVAVGYESPTDFGGARCVEDTQPTLCAAPGEIELPTIPLDYIGQSIDGNLAGQYGHPMLGAAWEIGTNATKVAIANATVTLDDPTQGTVVYVDRGPTSFIPRAGATGTGAEGWFLVYLKGAPTTITVSEPLHQPVKYKVATSFDWPSTLIAALNRK